LEVEEARFAALAAAGTHRSDSGAILSRAWARRNLQPLGRGGCQDVEMLVNILAQEPQCDKALNVAPYVFVQLNRKRSFHAGPQVALIIKI
jgi:hypothetical protein